MADRFRRNQITAIVSAFSFEAIPAGYCPLIVQGRLDGPAANGFHRTASDDSPYIVVPYGQNWSQAASHELLRMLANPAGTGRTAGPSRMSGQGTVEYLWDVCAPCQDVAAAYAIDGVAVSDFCTKAFFGGPGRAGCSFTGAVRTAFEPIAHGLVSWLADDGLIYQVRANHAGVVRVYGGFSPANRGQMMLGELVDMLTPERMGTLANALPAVHVVEAKSNARRAKFTNLMRFGGDVADRFVRPPVAAEAAERPRTGIDWLGQRAASGEVERTLRTAS